MTVHEMTLPGQPPQGDMTCYAHYCKATFTESEVRPGDTRDAWHRTLDEGPKAIDKYLKEKNYPEHKRNCPFEDLPPSVHLWCSNRDSEAEALAEELERLKEARGS